MLTLSHSRPRLTMSAVLDDLDAYERSLVVAPGDAVCPAVDFYKLTSVTNAARYNVARAILAAPSVVGFERRLRIADAWFYRRLRNEARDIFRNLNKGS